MGLGGWKRQAQDCKLLSVRIWKQLEVTVVHFWSFFFFLVLSSVLSVRAKSPLFMTLSASATGGVVSVLKLNSQVLVFRDFLLFCFSPYSTITVSVESSLTASGYFKCQTIYSEWRADESGASLLSLRIVVYGPPGFRFCLNTTKLTSARFNDRFCKCRNIKFQTAVWKS